MLGAPTWKTSHQPSNLKKSKKNAEQQLRSSAGNQVVTVKSNLCPKSSNPKTLATQMETSRKRRKCHGLWSSTFDPAQPSSVTSQVAPVRYQVPNQKMEVRRFPTAWGSPPSYALSRGIQSCQKMIGGVLHHRFSSETIRG